MREKEKLVLTEEQEKEVQAHLERPVVMGECRQVFLCQNPKCGKIQSHDFIPYGIGRGRWRDMCICNAVSRNWIFGAIMVGEKTSVQPRQSLLKQPG